MQQTKPLLVVEEQYGNGTTKIIRQGRNRGLLNQYLQELEQSQNVAFVLREAKATDNLQFVPDADIAANIPNKPYILHR